MVTTTFLILWAAFASLMSVFVLDGWFIMLWIVIGFIISYLVTAFIYIVLHIPFMLMLKVNNPYKGYITRSIAFFLNKFLFNIHIKTIGKKNIPKKGPLVVYANHKSFVDPFVVMETVGRPAGYTPKDKLYRLPVINKWFDIMHCMKVTRDDNRKTAEALVTAIKNVKSGYTMVVYPEGGIKDRSTEDMVQTRAGAFKLAVKAEATIIPVTIIGTLGTDKRMPFKVSKVTMIYHAPILYADYKDLTTAQIGDNVMNIVNEGMKKNK